MFIYKLVNNKLDCVKLIEQIGIKVPNRLPRYPITHLFHTKASNTNLGENSPLNRLSKEMNSYIKSSPDVDIYHNSVNIFKTHILNHKAPND